MNAATKSDIPDVLERQYARSSEELRTAKDLTDTGVTIGAQHLRALQEAIDDARTHMNDETPERLMGIVTTAVQTIVGKDAIQPVFNSSDCIYTGEKLTP